MQNEPGSLEEVAVLMRDNLPPDLWIADFGKQIGWGRGNEAARARMTTLRVEELRAIGLAGKTS
jgi:hypothetical protein